MKFKDLKPGDVFRIPSPWKDIPDRHYMKVVNKDAPHLNAVAVYHWRAGTLDYAHDDTEVIKVHSTYCGD